MTKDEILERKTELEGFRKQLIAQLDQVAKQRQIVDNQIADGTAKLHGINGEIAGCNFWLSKESKENVGPKLVSKDD